MLLCMLTTCAKPGPCPRHACRLRPSPASPHLLLAVLTLFVPQQASAPERQHQPASPSAASAAAAAAAGLSQSPRSAGKRRREGSRAKGRLKWLRAALRASRDSPTHKSRAALLHLMRCDPRGGGYLVGLATSEGSGFSLTLTLTALRSWGPASLLGALA